MHPIMYHILLYLGTDGGMPSAQHQFQLTPKYSHPLIGPVDLPNMLWLALPFDAGTPR